MYNLCTCRERQKQIESGEGETYQKSWKEKKGYGYMSNFANKSDGRGLNTHPPFFPTLRPVKYIDFSIHT